MSRLDDELVKAVEESEASRADPPAVAAEALSAPAKKRNVALLLGLLVAGGALLALVFTTFDDAAIYSKGVDEVVAKKDSLMKRNLRVEGMLVKGTLERRDEPCEYRFQIEKNGASMSVRYAQCVVPDTFRDVPGMDVAVTAEGKLSAGGHFEASQIMAKCPSKYEMKERQAKGEQAPHGAVPGSAPAAAN